MRLDVNKLLNTGRAATRFTSSAGKDYRVKLYLLTDEVRPLYKALIDSGDFHAGFNAFLSSLILVHKFEVYHVCVLTPDALGLFIRLNTVQVEFTELGYKHWQPVESAL